MLSSSHEYLQALREGKYLRFLEWLQFVSEHYGIGEGSQDSDMTIDLLTFEWLKNGFCEEDVKKIAILYAAQYMESEPIRGKLSYALISISNAAFNCMVYQNNKLQEQCLKKGTLNRAEVYQLMGLLSVSLGKTQFIEHLKNEQSKFLTQIKTVDKGLVTKACEQINAITQLRYLIEDYHSSLEAIMLPDDELKGTRVSVIIRLSKYLNEQMELTTPVTDEITIYVKKLRELKPAAFEEQYLNDLSPLSFVDNSWKFVTSLSVTLFRFIQPIQTLSITSEPTKSSTGSPTIV